MTSLLGILIYVEGIYFWFPSWKIYYCNISGYGLHWKELHDEFNHDTVIIFKLLMNLSSTSHEYEDAILSEE